MNYPILEGKKGIIFGALDEKSIAWQVALAAKNAGAKFILTNTAVAIRMGKIKDLATICGCELIASDATNMDDLRNLFTESEKILGGKIDFILHAVGMSNNIRKEKPYTSLDYNFYQKTMDVSAFSFHKILQTAWELDALAPRASVLAMSFIAAQKAVPGYGDMSEAKAALEAIARNFGFYYGKKNGTRVNTISQSPTKTTAGNGIKDFDKLFDQAQNLSPLGNANAASCADFCVMMFSDYTKMVTMQNIYHDGGFSNTVINPIE